MDGAIEKVGVYEFFCIFISGLIFSTICLCTGIPTVFMLWVDSNSTITLLTFLAMSCFWGMILQGIGAFVDKEWEWLGLSHHVRKNFLSKEKHRVFKEESERGEFKLLVDKIVKEKYGGKNTLTSRQEKCYWVYQYCETELEYNGKNTKIERIGSLFGLYRSLMVMGPVLIVVHLTLCLLGISGQINVSYNYSPTDLAIIIVLFFSVSSFFRHRAAKYARYKVRTVFREYRQFISQKKKSTQP